MSRPRLELESALFLLARIEQPDLDARPYRRAMDAMASEVRRRAEKEPPGLGRPLCLAQYLGQELGYAGSQEDYHHPDRIHLHRVIETKLGMPLALSALYLFVARRAGLRAGIVPLPGHVMLRLYAAGDSGPAAGAGKDRSLLVDPFHRGALRTRRECQQYLSQHGLASEPSWFRDAEDDALFLRHVRNLHHSARRRGLGSLARELERVARALVRARGGRVPGRRRG